MSTNNTNNNNKNKAIMKKKSIYGHNHEITAKGEMTLKNGKKRKLVYTKENDWMLKSDFRINDEEYLSLPTKEL